jgi:hypothetical protein
MTRVGWLIALAPLLASCIGTGVCDPYYEDVLSARLQLDGTDAALLKADESLSVTGPLGMAWLAAGTDSSTAPAGLGTVTLKADSFMTLVLALPFPLVTGQSVSLGEGQFSLSPSIYQFVPGPGAATAFLEGCPAGPPNCQVFDTQSVEGTLTVEQSKPPVIRIDATFSDTSRSDGPVVSVNGSLTFVVPPPTKVCNYND